MSAVSTAAAGFDGYVDRIVRVVRESGENAAGFYRRINDFSEAVRGMAGYSGEFELVTANVRIGGNAVNMADALARNGVKVKLIAAAGHKVFDELHSDIELLSYGVPGDTMALEFDDGKVMLADSSGMRASIISASRDGQIRAQIEDAYTEASLCVLANWACMPEMQDMWDIAAGAVNKRNDSPLVFLDLADFTKRRDVDIKRLVNFIKALSGRVYLGLNEKETLMLAKRLGYAGNGLSSSARDIYAAAGCGVVAHAVGYSAFCGQSGEITVKGRISENPVISTGAGDRFNATWCWAAVNGYTMEDALSYANGAVYQYVSSGA